MRFIEPYRFQTFQERFRQLDKQPAQRIQGLIEVPPFRFAQNGKQSFCPSFKFQPARFHFPSCLIRKTDQQPPPILRVLFPEEDPLLHKAFHHPGHLLLWKAHRRSQAAHRHRPTGIQDEDRPKLQTRVSPAEAILQRPCQLPVNINQKNQMIPSAAWTGCQTGTVLRQRNPPLVSQ